MASTDPRRGASRPRQTPVGVVRSFYEALIINRRAYAMPESAMNAPLAPPTSGLIPHPREPYPAGLAPGRGNVPLLPLLLGVLLRTFLGSNLNADLRTSFRTISGKKDRLPSFCSISYDYPDQIAGSPSKLHAADILYVEI